jgi:Cu/Ag efflux protein CusF
MQHTMRFLVCAALMTAVSSLQAQEKAQTAAEKGKMAVQVTRVTATVEAIDQKTRAVTLKDSKGEKHSFVAGPDVRNLAQVSVGDVVTIDYGQAAAIKLAKTDKKVRERLVSESVDRAAKGQMPGGTATREVSVIASVEAIDVPNKAVTLRGPENTVTVQVKDPKMLEGVKQGDFVQAVYVEALAIKVEKAAKK